MKSQAKIEKRGSQWCVLSENGKNLGCSSTREGAVKRLKQVEFFKNKGKAMAEYDNLFDNMSVGDMRPDSVERPSNTPSATPHRPVDITAHPTHDRPALIPEGTVAGHASENVLDRKDHFPVITESQAQSSVARSMQLAQIPDWYRGTLDELRFEVWAGATAAHPGLKFKVSVPVESVVALSDGEEAPDTKKSDLKNPEDTLIDKVPQVSRPSVSKSEYLHHLTIACQADNDRKAIAGNLIEHLEKQEEALQKAMKVAKRLMKDGLTGEEFAGLVSFLQEDVLRDLLMSGAEASVNFDRRQELLDRVSAKPEDKKKKKRPKPY